MIKNIIEINDDIVTLLLHSNINTELLDELNTTLETDYINFELNVKSNVAIAAAVTSYARIDMIPHILDPNTVYTDTDSIFTKTELSKELVGDDLGMMKDELKGLTIQEAIFLDIKKYGYYYYDKNGTKVEKSVVAGVERNSLSFDDIKNIFNGEIITRNIPSRFYKSFKDLNISVETTQISIQNLNNKPLINKIYQPLTINHIKSNPSINLKNIGRKILTNFKRIICIIKNKINKLK